MSVVMGYHVVTPDIINSSFCQMNYDVIALS